MKTRIVNICIALALVAGGYVLGRGQMTVVHAQANDPTPGEFYFETNAPKAWGHVVGVESGELIFEDASGTIRYFYPGMIRGRAGDERQLRAMVIRK